MNTHVKSLDEVKEKQIFKSVVIFCVQVLSQRFFHTVTFVNNTLTVLVKGEVHPRTGHEGTEGK